MENLTIFVRQSPSVNRPYHNSPGKPELLSLCMRLKVKVSKINPCKNGYKLCVPSSADADKIFLNNALSILTDAGFEPVMPDVLKKNRTVFIRNLDNSICEHSNEEILKEINDKNSSISAVEVFKFPKSQSMKLSLRTSQMATSIIDNGLYMFYLSIPKYDIKKDIYVRLINCYNCYAIHDHHTNECPQGNKTLCSKCSSAEHTHWNCPRKDNFKCINCSGPHHTLQLKCPLRRNMIRDIRRKIASNDPHAKVVTAPKTLKDSYAKVAALKQDVINPNTSAFMASAFIHLSLIKELQAPGCFHPTFLRLCSDHKLPHLNLSGFKPPPAHVIKQIVSNPKVQQFHSNPESDTSFYETSDEADQCPGSPIITPPNQSTTTVTASVGHMTAPALASVSPASATAISDASESTPAPFDCGDNSTSPINIPPNQSTTTGSATVRHMTASVLAPAATASSASESTTATTTTAAPLDCGDNSASCSPFISPSHRATIKAFMINGTSLGTLRLVKTAIKDRKVLVQLGNKTVADTERAIQLFRSLDKKDVESLSVIEFRKKFG